MYWKRLQYFHIIEEADLRQEFPFPERLYIRFIQAVQICMDHLTDTVPTEYCSGNILGILQIYLILFIIAVICKFRISGHIDLTFSVRTVCKLQVPYLVRLSKWYIISYF